MLKLSYKLLILVSAVCYVASWFLPVFIATDKIGTGPMSGLSCFINGILAGWLFWHFEAFANLVYIITLTLFCCSDKRPAFWASLICLLIATQAFTMHGFHFEMVQGNFKVESFQLGFYLWYLSFVIVFVVGLLNLKAGKSRDIDTSSVILQARPTE